MQANENTAATGIPDLQNELQIWASHLEKNYFQDHVFKIHHEGPHH